MKYSWQIQILKDENKSRLSRAIDSILRRIKVKVACTGWPLRNVQCTMYNVQCTMYNAQCTGRPPQYTMNNVPMYNVQASQGYRVQCTGWPPLLTISNFYPSLRSAAIIHPVQLKPRYLENIRRKILQKWETVWTSQFSTLFLVLVIVMVMVIVISVMILVMVLYLYLGTLSLQTHSILLTFLKESNSRGDQGCISSLDRAGVILTPATRRNHLSSSINNINGALSAWYRTTTLCDSESFWLLGLLLTPGPWCPAFYKLCILYTTYLWAMGGEAVLNRELEGGFQ